MSNEAMRTNLGDWENAPTVQDRVIAYMDSLGAPALLREVYRPLGLPRYAVNRVLGRLHAKGIVMRWRIPVEMHRPGRRTASAAPGATRQCFLYAFVDGACDDGSIP